MRKDIRRVPESKKEIMQPRMLCGGKVRGESMKLTTEEMNVERRYQGLMFFVKQMFREGMITSVEFEQITLNYNQFLGYDKGEDG